MYMRGSFDNVRVSIASLVELEGGGMWMIEGKHVAYEILESGRITLYIEPRLRPVKTEPAEEASGPSNAQTTEALKLPIKKKAPPGRPKKNARSLDTATRASSSSASASVSQDVAMGPVAVFEFDVQSAPVRRRGRPKKEASHPENTQRHPTKQTMKETETEKKDENEDEDEDENEDEDEDEDEEEDEDGEEEEEKETKNNNKKKKSEKDKKEEKKMMKAKALEEVKKSTDKRSGTTKEKVKEREEEHVVDGVPIQRQRVMLRFLSARRRQCTLSGKLNQVEAEATESEHEAKVDSEESETKETKDKSSNEAEVPSVQRQRRRSVMYFTPPLRCIQRPRRQCTKKENDSAENDEGVEAEGDTQETKVRTQEAEDDTEEETQDAEDKTSEDRSAPRITRRRRSVMHFPQPLRFDRKRHRLCREEREDIVKDEKRLDAKQKKLEGKYAPALEASLSLTRGRRSPSVVPLRFSQGDRRRNGPVEIANTAAVPTLSSNQVPTLVTNYERHARFSRVTRFSNASLRVNRRSLTSTIKQGHVIKVDAGSRPKQTDKPTMRAVVPDQRRRAAAAAIALPTLLESRSVAERRVLGWSEGATASRERTRAHLRTQRSSCQAAQTAEVLQQVHLVKPHVRRLPTHAALSQKSHGEEIDGSTRHARLLRQTGPIVKRIIPGMPTRRTARTQVARIKKVSPRKTRAVHTKMPRLHRIVPQRSTLKAALDHAPILNRIVPSGSALVATPRQAPKLNRIVPHESALPAALYTPKDKQRVSVWSPRTLSAPLPRRTRTASDGFPHQSVRYHAPTTQRIVPVGAQCKEALCVTSSVKNIGTGRSKKSTMLPNGAFVMTRSIAKASQSRDGFRIIAPINARTKKSSLW